MRIMRASEAHLDDIVSLNRVVQDIHVEHEPGRFCPFAEAAVRDYLLGLFGDPAVTFVLALDEERVLGYVMLHVYERAGGAYGPPRKYLELEQIAVAPDSREQGVGSALVDEAFAVARTLEIQDLELSVWQFNESAQRLFNKKGFTPCWHRMRTRIP
jgi:ribosomal protein S18 acetylase RimI-like enzyme